MFATLPRLSKASRRPLTTKRGNKDYYKGTRQAFLPGGHRTGAPGKHVIGGKGKYRLLDEKVRVFVAPPIEEINNSPLKPYVHTSVTLTPSQSRAAFGRFRTAGGLTPEHYFNLLRSNAISEAQDQKSLELAGGPKPPGATSARLYSMMETLGLR